MASKILLADDSITIQKVVNLTFADEGIDVITVSNGEMAERRLSEINPDLVLADIFMPGKNGYELCQFIKDTPPYQNIPVVLLVGAFEPFDQSEARRVRADGHLTKPFESRTLVETVRKLIQNSRSKSNTAKQSSAKQPQPIRDTRPLGPEPEQSQDAFIDVSQIVSDGSLQMAAPNGAPASSNGQEGAGASNGGDPLGVDYHGLWETGASQESNGQSGNTIGGEVSFPIDLGASEAPQQSDPIALFSSGFEISAPTSEQAGSEPASGAFEFGFAEAPAEVHADSAGSPASQENELVQSVTPVPQAEASPDQATGFAVPSLFSGSAQDQVFDFKQVEAPEPPAPANEVSFELSAVPAEPGQPALVAEPASGDEGGYFDLIAEEKPLASESPEPIQWTVQAPEESLESRESKERGFDHAPAATEEEPLGDVFSPEKSGASGQETSFAIAEEAITVDARPPAGESFRMVLPSTREGELSGAWPQLESNQEPAAFGSPGADSPGVAASGSEVSKSTEFSATVNPERSFDFSEGAPVASHFDPMELRADEPTEAGTSMPFQSSVRQQPAEEFTSSLMWTQEVQAPAPGVASVQDSQPVQEEAAAGPPAEAVLSGEWPGVSEESLVPLSGEALPETITVSSSPSEVPQSATGQDESVPDRPAEPGSALAALPPAAIDEIVRRVVSEMSDAIVRELAWEVLPDCVERVVEKLSRESLAKKL